MALGPRRLGFLSSSMMFVPLLEVDFGRRVGRSDAAFRHFAGSVLEHVLDSSWWCDGSGAAAFGFPLFFHDVRKFIAKIPGSSAIDQDWVLASVRSAGHALQDIGLIFVDFLALSRRSDGSNTFAFSRARKTFRFAVEFVSDHSGVEGFVSAAGLHQEIVRLHFRSASHALQGNWLTFPDIFDAISL